MVGEEEIRDDAYMWVTLGTYRQEMHKSMQVGGGEMILEVEFRYFGYF